MGINQGLTWSVTQISSVDSTNDKHRGFAVGLNEFSGYLGVALGGILVSYMTSLLLVKIALFSFFSNIYFYCPIVLRLLNRRYKKIRKH